MLSTFTLFAVSLSRTFHLAKLKLYSYYTTTPRSPPSPPSSHLCTIAEFDYSRLLICVASYNSSFCDKLISMRFVHGVSCDQTFLFPKAE